MSLVKSISKSTLKEKVVEIYEMFFFGVDISGGREEFWDEFFLLKVNVLGVQQNFDKHNLEEIMCLKPQINRLFKKCLEAMHESHWFRVANAAQTMICFVNGVFSSTTVIGQTSTLVDILIGNDSFDGFMQSLILISSSLLINSKLIRIKAIVLNMIMSMASANNLLNENPFIDYMLSDEIIEAAALIISDYNYQTALGKEALLLITLLMQHCRHKNNFCRMKMSILEEQIVLNGISHMISLMFVDYIKKQNIIMQSAKGVLSSITSMIGSFLIKPEVYNTLKMTESCFLLTLFDFLELNSHFAYIIASSHPALKAATVTQDNPNNLINDSLVNSSTDPVSIQDDPTNMIAVFLEYCSIIMQDIKETSSYNNCRLCFLILLSLAEDQNTAITLHDSHVTYKVVVHKKQMRHRKQILEEESTTARPLVCSAVDVLVEFLTSHMMKAFPADLFSIALNVIHRFVCLQKNKKLRIKYDWKPLWSTLITLVRYLINNHEDLPQKCNVFELISKIEIIFDLFITYGDNFLYSPVVYDDLYYELVRMASVFENLYTFVLRMSLSQSESKHDATIVLDQLINIRAIINHFSPKIQAWADENQLSSLSREQILEIVGSNYDSLTLKLHHHLDKYDHYNEESQKERAFFNNLTRCVVVDIREHCFQQSIELQNNLRDILISSNPPDANYQDK